MLHRPDAVLALTVVDDDSIFAAMRTVARSHVLKGAEQCKIARTIMAVADEAIFGPAVATRVLTYFATPSPPRPRFPNSRPGA